MNTAIRESLTTDNTATGETPVTPDLTVWANSKVPTLFNGDFEAGNMNRGDRVYLLARKDSTPGWAFHQLDAQDKSPVNIVDYQLSSGGLGHAAELSIGGDSELVHNRFYLPAEATAVKFNYLVREVEYGAGDIPRQPQLSVVLKEGIVETLLGTISSTLTTSQGIPSSTADFLSGEFTIPQSLSLHGKSAELIFRLSFVPGQPAHERGHARIWIDNVRFGPSGVPLQAEAAAQSAGEFTTLNLSNLTTLLEVSRLGWSGMVEAPNGVTGLVFGSVGVPTAELSAINQGNPQEDGRAGSGEGSFNGQLLLANFDEFSLSINQAALAVGVSPLVEGLSDSTSIVTDQVGGDDDPSFSTNTHAVHSQHDTLLLSGQQARLAGAIVNEGVTDHAPVRDGGALVDEGAIVVSNGNLSGDLASGGGNGTASDLNVFELEKLALEPFVGFDAIGFESGRLVGADLFIEGTARLRNDENQQSQYVLQHNLSFGTLTLPPHQNLVNSSGSFETGFVGLTADQLALLNQATITIADLADGYLALTLGNTITLDTDATGYGWFIDSTPLMNEEFSADAASPWQFTALDGSAADGKIDLMTVLMHELGHVMGLGHVSSAVDSTRLMAGSIDPGIRRLPSSLDLVPVEPSHDNHSEFSTQNSAPQIWAPYLAHYTVTSTGDQAPAPVINPAQLVQAEQIPSHAGIFNSNFAISDPLSATFGWDESGAVTIANGQAVLSEDSNVISTLSQLFTLPAGSTHLRFTLVDANLHTNGANRPSDAFEVAFLESSTLMPFAGVTAGLTQTDSLFNLQQDGTVRFSNRVSLSNGTISGSTLDLTQPVIVDIDLTGITAGAGARLSFDLLGFGDRTSTIVIDNVLLTDGTPTAAPVAVNDSYSVAEGTTLNVPMLRLLTNDSDPDSPTFSLTTFSLASPAHGTLTLNTDGSFTYVHNGSETVTDSFTYRVSDGINFSNIATVSLTITPTITAIPAQSVEQGRTLAVQVVAADPDDSNISPESSVHTFSLQPNTLSGVTLDPATGLFTWTVPSTQAVGLYTIAVNVTDAGTLALSATRSFTVDVLELSNTAPTLDPIGPKTVNEETELRFTVSATDLDLPTQALVYSATGLPTGATFDPTSREFVWTPTEDQGPGSYVVTFGVTDGVSTVSEAVTITVAEVNVAPVLAGCGLVLSRKVRLE